MFLKALGSYLCICQIKMGQVLKTTFSSLSPLQRGKEFMR